jgi:hypothetical protein
MEKPDPDLTFAAPFDLLDPTLWRLGARLAAAKTSDIEIDWFAKRVWIWRKGSSGIEGRGCAVSHGRSIRTFDSPSDSNWVGCFGVNSL